MSHVLQVLDFFKSGFAIFHHIDVRQMWALLSASEQKIVIVMEKIYAYIIDNFYLIVNSRIM